MENKIWNFDTSKYIIEMVYNEDDQIFEWLNQIVFKLGSDSKRLLRGFVLQNKFGNYINYTIYCGLYHAEHHDNLDNLIELYKINEKDGLFHLSYILGSSECSFKGIKSNEIRDLVLILIKSDGMNTILDKNYNILKNIDNK